MEDGKEKLAFIELKKRMKGTMENELYEDENMFYRFLRARDLNVDKTENMLRQHLEWRKKYDVKNILKRKLPMFLEKYLVVTNLGLDKNGCIVKYHHFSNTDFRGVIESYKTEDILKCLIYYCERDVQEMKIQSKKTGKLVDKVVYIENMENFSLAKATDKKVISQIISTLFLYLNNYPETMKTVYVINGPVYFSLFYSVIKTFLPSTVIEKVKIYSDDSYKRDLLKTIDAEVLPAFLGGKRTDPDGDPRCLTVIKNPESVPKRFYLCNKQSYSSCPGVEQITVPIAAVHEICLDVKEPGCYLEWEFQLKSGDIEFGLLYQDYEGERIEIIPVHTVNTNAYIEGGFHWCVKRGIYIAVFDNTDSHLESKKVYYQITLKQPYEVSLDETFNIE